MSNQISNYQCPSCGGPLQFSPETGNLSCEYCDSSFSVAEIEALYAEKDANARAAAQQAEETRAKERALEEEYGVTSPWSEAEAANLKVYLCPSCGAELICDQTTAATSCAYCGNNTIVPGQLGDNLKPDLVIPFRVSKEAAIEALKKHYEKKPLLPKVFSRQNHLEEIKGIYVPFWLYGGETEGKVEYRAEKVRRWSEGNYNVTETRIYDVTRGGNIYFTSIPANASSKMPDVHMEAIEPYDFDELQPFSTAYLPGFLADKYDIDAENILPRVEERAKNSTVQKFQETVEGYTTTTMESEDLTFEPGKGRYALLPVWLLSTKWKDQNYLFAMNGQTGKLIGDLPIDKKKSRLVFFGLWAAVAAIVLLLQNLM